MTEHTPTPWYHRQDGEFTRMGDPLDWIADSPERGQHRKIIVSRDSCYCAADYAFIVKAVNNHDALIQALLDADNTLCALGLTMDAFTRKTIAGVIAAVGIPGEHGK